jgi:phosphoglycolate phosphatase
VSSATTYDFWLFDLDGTLVDTEFDYVRETMGRVGERLGCGFSDREARLLWHGHRDARKRILDRTDVSLAEFWRTFDAIDDPQARAEATFLYEDARPVGDLDGPAGLVTHCPAPMTAAVLENLDVRDWFDSVVCCDDDLGWKPDPGPVETAMGDLGVNGVHAGALAGDGPGDVGAAWNAGLDALHVARKDPDALGRCVLADHRIESFADVFEA